MVDSSTALPAALATRFRVERRLHTGGVADTYLVHDVRDACETVLHLLPIFPNPLATARFVREMGIGIQLLSDPHPNILRVLEAGEADGVPWYVTPLVDGEWLGDRLRREPPLPLDAALRITHDVARGLAHAHQRYLLHGDLSPRSILLAEQRAVVADFWVGWWAWLEGQSAATADPGTATASPYWSPELVAGGAQRDERSDLYALGCVAFEMLAGRLPAAAPARRRPLPWGGRPQALRNLRPDVSRAVAAAVERAMAPEPADRFPTALAFLEALGPAPTP